MKSKVVNHKKYGIVTKEGTKKGESADYNESDNTQEIKSCGYESENESLIGTGMRRVRMKVQLMGYMDNPLAESERQQRQREKAELIRRKKKEQEYFIRQKFIGLSAVICGITALHISRDSVIALLLIPFGITAMFSHKKVITEGQ